jgi:hypothetical protein
MVKKGQAAGAAILLAIIAGVLVFFIILVSPAERAEILNGDLDEADNNNIKTVDELLLEESPGRLDYLQYNYLEHPLPVVNVYSSVEGTLLAQKNIVDIKRSLFNEVQDQLNFKVDYVDNVKGLILSFDALEAQGELIISLNGDVVYKKKISGKISDPIELPLNLLERENTLIFQISSPGTKFWSTNHIRLNDVKIYADIKKTDSQSSRNSFLISDIEKTNMEKAILNFRPDCNLANVGKLIILVNGHEIYNAIPDCGSGNIPLDVSRENLYVGENSITFKTEEGRYEITHINLKSILNEIEYPIYYFQLTYEENNKIKDNDYEVELELNFVDDVERKRGVLIINGQRRHFDTKDVTLNYDISGNVVSGTNSIKIEPYRTIDVRDLKVFLNK